MGRSGNNSLRSLLASVLKELVRFLDDAVDPFERKGEHLGDLGSSIRSKEPRIQAKKIRKHDLGTIVVVFSIIVSLRTDRQSNRSEPHISKLLIKTSFAHNLIYHLYSPY